MQSLFAGNIVGKNKIIARITKIITDFELYEIKINFEALIILKKIILNKHYNTEPKVGSA